MGNSKSNTLEEKSNNGFLSNQSYSIYNVIGPNGDGELVELMKIALKTNDFAHVDEFIRNKVSKFLMNNGEGQMVC